MQPTKGIFNNKKLDKECQYSMDRIKGSTDDPTFVTFVEGPHK